MLFAKLHHLFHIIAFEKINRLLRDLIFYTKILFCVFLYENNFAFQNLRLLLHYYLRIKV